MTNGARWLAGEVRHVLGPSDDGEVVEDLAVDEVGHGVPCAPGGETGELRLQRAVPDGVEDRLIRPGRGVEGDLAAGVAPALGELRFSVAHDHEDRPGDAEVVEGAAAGGEALLEGGEDHGLVVGPRGERVEQDAVAALSGQGQHGRPDAGQPDGDGMVVGFGYPERRHQRVPVVGTFVVEPLTGAPGLPDRRQRLEEVAHLLDRPAPRHREPSLDVGLHLAAEPEPEPAAGYVGQLPGGLGDGHRAAGEGYGDGRADLGRARGGGGGVAVQERVVARLGDPHRAVPGGLGGGCLRADRGQPLGVQEGVDHGRAASTGLR